MKKKIQTTSHFLDKKFSQLIESSGNEECNKFINSLKKVVRLLKIDGNEDFSTLLTNNIRTMTADIEMNLDEFLEGLNIPFRTEDFLLILFQELYEQFIYEQE
jgi:hypothetical protein